ncbi:uroporphyrinogen-III C-methyltransferase [Roseicella sp. DB1501]|nr:uroporphyrinogen-III C-methyltransferase [Roseicella sp. DB1501]
MARAAGVLVNAVAAPPRAHHGRASLVGAGPGDPALLTVKAVRALETADVVLYDKLIDPRLLDLAPARARRIDVGKRCGRHAMSQAAINRLLVAEVRRGGHVVRLKGGDPFIFGRGGEELEALREAGARVEVVPGITAALATAARLGMPLTHRGLSRSLHLITAHGRDAEGLPQHDWRALAVAGGTLAVYMGARTLPRVAEALLAAGMSPATPAIAVENATLPGERRIRRTLADIAGAVAEAAVEGPTLTLIGEVVALADERGEAARRAA